MLLKLFHVVFPDLGRPGNGRAVSSDCTALGGVVRWETFKVSLTHTHAQAHTHLYAFMIKRWNINQYLSTYKVIGPNTHTHSRDTPSYSFSHEHKHSKLSGNCSSGSKHQTLQKTRQWTAADQTQWVIFQPCLWWVWAQAGSFWHLGIYNYPSSCLRQGIWPLTSDTYTPLNDTQPRYSSAEANSEGYVSTTLMPPQFTYPPQLACLNTRGW